ncbi:homeobox protein SIX6-like [Sycon ciliatum]|uniref:homeobox protein SIX6-like n=1 Tax=Sycon ciliatum TaxID=27933 RepID=UPI0031F6A45A
MSVVPLLSIADIESACNTLLEARQFDRLDRLLWSLPRTPQFTNNDSILVSRCALCYQQRRYSELYSMLRNRCFDRAHHATLQNLWFEAHYDEAEQRRCGKALGPVGKYRVRRKYPPPATICEGPQPSFCFDERVRETLTVAFNRSQYPTAQQKQELAAMTNLTIVQVSNWFKNKRQRSRGHQDDMAVSSHSSSSSQDGTPAWVVRGSDCSSPTSTGPASSDSSEHHQQQPHQQPQFSIIPHQPAALSLPAGLVMWRPQTFVEQRPVEA